MSPLQHHFPYFLDLQNLNRALAPFGWNAIFDMDAPSRKEVLCIRQRRNNDILPGMPINLFHGTFLMVTHELLYTWIRYHEGLLIRLYDLSPGMNPVRPEEEFIDILGRDPGSHTIHANIIYDHFVTFIRMEDLVTPHDWHEKYVVVHIHGDRLDIIPFTTFNETGGDPLYMWPALASFDTEKGILYGHGMRMGSFEERMDMRLFGNSDSKQPS